MNELAHLASLIPEIDPEARYWFFRTEGGKLYPHFIASNSIAIGYSKVGLSPLLGLPKNKAQARESVGKLIEKQYPEKKSRGFAISQLVTFALEMKKGDYVLIPSHATAHIAIGVLTEDAAFETKDRDQIADYPDFIKRRRVRWLKHYAREQFNPKVWRVLNAHQTIVDATSFAPWIDPMLFDLFKKGTEYHYSVKVQKEEHINARSLFDAFSELLVLGDELAEEENLPGKSDQINARVNLNSPGAVELAAVGALMLCGLAVLVVAISGGGMSFSGDKRKLTLSSDGLIKRMNDFLNDAKRREILESVRKKLARLDIKKSEQVAELIDTVANQKSNPSNKKRL